MFYKISKKILYIGFALLYLTSPSFSERNSKEWNIECAENKNLCLIGINYEVNNKETNKNRTLAKAYFIMGLSKQKKMDLINSDDQTYKLSEESKNVPVLFVELPLNTDLRAKPQIQIDNKAIGNLTYTHCNPKEGCKTNVAVNDEVINLFKKGKTMTVVMRIYGKKDNVKVEFPLKNFSKSYKELLNK